ncbi:MAG: PKD domain-containing protein [Acidobacteria bacterium]|nr:MAG: PKD domain-containing protein [Acidobacteriota bacterium]
MHRTKRFVGAALVAAAHAHSPLLAESSDEIVSRLVESTAAMQTLESRTFYTGALQWYFQASSLGSLSMRGHDSTLFGGTVTSVTGCFYNESAFQRRFEASMSVRQDGRTIESIPFGRFFPSQQFTCHTLTGFDADLEPGDFEIVVSYDRGNGDNFWAGLGATTGGQTFDVQIGSQRPPSVDGPQGPQPIRGIGIRYSLLTNDAPPPPEPDFEFTTSGLMVSFDNTTPGAAAFAWDFGDGGTSALANPVHTYGAAGSYDVTLTATTAAGSGSITKTVTVQGPPPPVADFSYSASGLSVAFIDQSLVEGAPAYLWEFGDGSTSSSFQPTHEYAEPGSYEVVLTVSNSTGSDSISRTVTVATPPGTLSFGPLVSLRNSRFEVSVTYRTATGAVRQAQGAAYEDASSFWHFFGEENIEVFVKVLDGCVLNGHFWVFAAGATDVGATIDVLDTTNDRSWTYSNPDGSTFATVTDTAALPCVTP